MSLVLDVVFFVVATLFSLFLRRQVAKHQLSIGRIAPLKLALYNIHYSGTLYEASYHFDFNASCICLQFHWPRRPNPKWLTFTAKDVLYKSNTADISSSNILSEFWFFPKLFGQTAGPWLNVQIDDFRIRVFGSNATPYFVKRLRENLVGAVLNGEILQLNDFGTSVRFSGVTEAAVQCEQDPDGDGQNEYPGENRDTVPQDGPYEEQLGNSNGAAHDSIGDVAGHLKNIRNDHKAAEALPSLNREQDEVRMSAFARGLMLQNKEGRVYSFGAIDAQLRRNWTANRGSFVMIAKDGRWVKVPWKYEMDVAPLFWTQLASSIANFPFDVVHALHYPMTAINLYVPRADITFDNFRLRDAELVPQSIALVEEKIARSDVEWQNVFADIIANVAMGYLRA